jgi:hypothetical protein
MILAQNLQQPSNGNDSIIFEDYYNKQLVRQIIFIFLFTTTILGFTQSRQVEYLEAKRQFTLGNYAAAKLAFQSLSDDQYFGSYSSFYYALSSFHKGEVQEATDMWKQILVKYPNWDKKEEVNYWLSFAYFSQKKYYEGFSFAQKLSEEVREALVDSFFNDLSTEALDSAYAINPKNKSIATYLAKSISKQPYEQRDHLMLIELSEKFDIPIKGNDLELPLIKKDTYSIGVVLPFMYEALDRPQSVLRNAIIFDLYQGMQLAQEELKRENISIELFPFDTQKSGSKTKQIVRNESLKSADVIIGPLYPEPSEVINQFSKDNRITMVNPVSSNGSLIGNNQFSYLFKPSYETQGRVAAQFAATSFPDNRKAFVFYETDRDSLIASAYVEALKRDSFLVIRFERLTKEDALQVQRDFTEQYEYRLDTIFNRHQIDSIGLLPGRYVRNRVMRDGRTGRILKNSQGENKLEYYEMKFLIARDSIGHIFAATTSNLLVNNLISLIEVRSDSIGLIGYDSWLSFNLLSFNQLERIGASMISTSYFDKSRFEYERMKRKFIQQTGNTPNEYHLTGFELIMQMGRLMAENGKYFQRGLIDGDITSGILMEGMKYGGFNDNQIVPIVKLEKLQLKNVNNQIEVEKEDED